MQLNSDISRIYPSCDIPFSRGWNLKPNSKRNCLKSIPTLMGLLSVSRRYFNIAVAIWIKLQELRPPEKGLLRFLRLRNFLSKSARALSSGYSSMRYFIYLQHYKPRCSSSMSGSDKSSTSAYRGSSNVISTFRTLVSSSNSMFFSQSF